MIPWLPPALTDLLVEATWQTLLMTFGGALAAVALGLPLALLLHTTGPEGLSPNNWLNRPLGLLVNAVRSTPFIILMVAIVPFTRLVAGTSIGTTAALVPLSLAATAFIIRLFENALREVDRGVIEAARAMGATRSQIMARVLVPGGRLGATVARLLGEEPHQQVEDDLRRFKQVIETGEVVRSDGSPDGPSARRQLVQHPGQPVAST